jgi:hypothetical protein
MPASIPFAQPNCMLTSIDRGADALVGVGRLGVRPSSTGNPQGRQAGKVLQDLLGCRGQLEL